MTTRNVGKDELFKPNVQACNTSSAAVPTGLEHWVTVAFDLSHRPTVARDITVVLVEPTVSTFSKDEEDVGRKNVQRHMDMHRPSGV